MRPYKSTLVQYSKSPILMILLRSQYLKVIMKNCLVQITVLLLLIFTSSQLSNFDSSLVCKILGRCLNLVYIYERAKTSSIGCKMMVLVEILNSPYDVEYLNRSLILLFIFQQKKNIYIYIPGINK